MSDTAFTPIESFECSSVTAVVANDEYVFLGTRAGTVEMVSADGRTSVDLSAPVTDLAVGRRVYAEVESSIIALSTAGTRVWSVDIEGVEQLAALTDEDKLGAVTTDDVLIGFDGEIGSRRFETDRPQADIADAPTFLGAADCFIHATWSFLSVLDPDGGERFTRNLNVAIESVGVVGDTIVLSLKNDRVVGVDAADGQRQWERELRVTDLPYFGAEQLLFTADDQLVSITPDGAYSRVQSVPRGDLYPTTDGSLFCIVADDTVSVYRSTGNPAESIVCEIDDSTVGPNGGAVSVTVSNQGDQPITESFGVEGDGMEVRTSEIRVDLDPDESVTRTVDVDSVAATDKAVLVVTVGDRHIAEEDVLVADSDPESFDSSVDLDRIADGVAVLAVTVYNDGDVPLSDIAISPGDAHVFDIVPGESATTTVKTEYQPGTDVPVTVSVGSQQKEQALSLPESLCNIGIERTTDDFIDVTVNTEVEAPIEAEVIIDGDAIDASVSRVLEIPSEGTALIALAPAAVDTPGTVRAAVPDLEIARAVTVKPSADPSRSTASVPPEPNPDEAVPRQAEENPRGPADEETNDGSAQDRHSSSDLPELHVDRQVVPSEPFRTQGVEEQISVTNVGDGPATSVQVSFPESTTSVSEIEPDEAIQLSRRHAFLRTGETAVPAGTITAANTSETAVESESLTVGTGDFAAEMSFTPAEEEDWKLEVAVINRREVDCTVLRIGIKGLDVWVIDDLRVPVNETVRWCATVPTDSVPANPIEAAIEYEFADGDDGHWGTLADVDDGGNSTNALSVAIDDKTRISGGYGSVVLVAENAGDTTLSDVTVEASGESVSDLMYGGSESIDQLSPGEALTHYVDIETNDPQASLSVTLSTDRRTEELSLRGPAPIEEGDWSESDLNAWEVERLTDSEENSTGRIASGIARVD